jgi:hypothetical protein
MLVAAPAKPKAKGSGQCRGTENVGVKEVIMWELLEQFFAWIINGDN